MEQYTVKQARRLANLTIREMAQKLGMSVTTYKSKESHLTRFYYDEACHFSEITGIPLRRISFFENSVAE